MKKQKQMKTQKQMLRAAEQRIFDACKTFNDIMSGPNPLTKDEIHQLTAKRSIWKLLFTKWH